MFAEAAEFPSREPRGLDDNLRLVTFAADQMKIRFLLAPAALAIAYGTAQAAQAAAAADAGAVVPLGTLVEGKSQLDWSRAWWEWAASFEPDTSPVYDRTGARCNAGQNGPVWFLAGTFGSARTDRTCTVPAGRFLFFPLVNSIAVDVYGIGCPYVLHKVTKTMNEPVSLFAEVDGRKIPGVQAHRLKSDGCFQAGGQMAASDGYYVMLRPLPPGRHVLKFGGEVELTSQLVSYTLDVL
jgi:hypothetical protein